MGTSNKPARKLLPEVTTPADGGGMLMDLGNSLNVSELRQSLLQRPVEEAGGCMFP